MTDDKREVELREAVMLTALSFDDQNYYAKWEGEMTTALDALIEYVREQECCYEYREECPRHAD